MATLPRPWQSQQVAERTGPQATHPVPRHSGQRYKRSGTSRPRIGVLQLGHARCSSVAATPQQSVNFVLLNLSQ